MEPVRCYIGIDIGKKGAIVSQGPEGVKAFKMMLDKYGDLDLHMLYTVLLAYSNGNPRVLFEDIGPIFRVGKTSYGTLMWQAGLTEGICLGLGLVYTKVSPKKWQAEMFQGVDDIRSPDGSRDTKAMAYKAAIKLFPKESFNFGGRATKPHDGLVDALLMSEYCKRRHNE